ncbi:ester cyclase [Cohnella sp. REN36]|uniref:ester cyclase n=1 Tax=Cohnella sp. REN36 TaxID=2887347 RepID=UPI001D13B16D|nr:ester cyclase [Cohnella sp. REN36]MCC3372583.1 ester cyclase [Cohnella sp. REN36]
MEQWQTGLVLDFIREFWNEGRTESLDRYLTDDYADHAYVPGDREGLARMADALRTAFPDQSSAVESVIAQGDRVIVRLRLTGTHQGNFRGKEATFLPVNVTLYREYRLTDGRIAEHWALLDTAALLRQIGAELHEQPACRIK